MGGTGDHHVKQSEPDSETQVLQVFSHIQKLDLKKTDEHKWRESKGGGGKTRENIIKVYCVHL
jgi:hypothetical protein